MDKIDSRLVQAVVVLDRQFRLIQRLVEREGSALTTLETAIEQRSTSLVHVLDAYNYILALIDHLARYEKTAWSVPRFNYKSPEYRALGSALGNIRDARDQLQHLNNHIENDNYGPLLGGICWVSGEKQFLVSLNEIGRLRSSPGIVFDTHAGKYLNDFCFTYGNTYYDLARALAGIRIFHEHILGNVLIEIEGTAYRAEEHFAALSIAFAQRLPTGENAVHSK